MDRQSQVIQRGRPVSGIDAAHANEYFDPFLNATTLKNILGYHRSICEFLHLKPNVFPLFYPKLRANLTTWRAKALWKKFDARASHKCYGKGKACANTRILIIGAGPCGLRTAIEAQLLGAKVVIVEKRDRLSRNNVLHLWPFVIEDLRILGAKKFFGKFCAGAIDHISIRQLQCILLKVALLLGVEIHTEVSFEKLIEPTSEKTGWKADCKPANHPVSQYEFDVIIGADGKRNTLQGFKRKEFRGKLAIAITANFINKKTEAEARVEEISGVAFIFNQKFFKDLQEETKIDLENIVYYKDDTHYFVMTAKKASLIEKGVIKQDLADTEKLLAPENVDREALQEYAKEAANFSTNYQMPDLEFAVNHYGLPDVAMFDFTSMYAAEYASKVVEKNASRLLMILVGDSLLEPFWPTGSGCARGFLSSLDAAWAIRSWSLGVMTPLEVLAERESIYRLLAQTTPDNLNKDWKSYTLDPVTRYPNLNKNVVMPHQVVYLYETDNPKSIERMRRNSYELQSEQPKKRRRNVDNEVLINWISDQIQEHNDILVSDLGSIFRDGKILCAIIHHYRPDLLDYNSIKNDDPINNNQLAFDILEKELGIPPIMTGKESISTEDYLTMASYLTQVYDTFRGEIPHIKHPKLKPTPSQIPKLVSKQKSSKKFRSRNVDSQFLENKNGVKVNLNNLQENENIGKLESPKKQKIYKNKDRFQENPLKKRKSNFKVKKRQKLSCSTNKKKSLTAVNDNFCGASYKTTVCGNLNRCSQNTNCFHTPKKEILCGIDECQNSFNEFTDFQTLERQNVNEVEKRWYLNVIEELKLRQKKCSSINLENNSIHLCSSRTSENVSEIKTIESDLHIPEERKEIKLEKNEHPHFDVLKKLYVEEEIERDNNNRNIKLDHSSKELEKLYLASDEILYNNFLPTNSHQEETCTNKNHFYNLNCDLTYNVKNNSLQHLPKLVREASKLPQQRSKDSSVNISVIEQENTKIIFRNINFDPTLNVVTIVSKKSVTDFRNGVGCKEKIYNDQKRQNKFKQYKNDCKFLPTPAIMTSSLSCEPQNVDQIFSRVSTWISQHDFKVEDEKLDADVNTVVTDEITSDITSITKCMMKNNDVYDDFLVEERTDEINCHDETPASSNENFSKIIKNINCKKMIKTLSKFSQYSPFQNGSSPLQSTSAPPTQFSVIVEDEESELPEGNKRTDISYKSFASGEKKLVTNNPQSRPSSRHKRHADAMAPVKQNSSIDRKVRKRRTLEKLETNVEERKKVWEEIDSNRSDRQNRRRQQRKLQTEQFYKSMQMLQANAKPDHSQPFEDYSIFLYRQTAPNFEDRVKDLEKKFTYVPEYENKLPGQIRGNTDEDFASRIKNLEDKWKEPITVEKKPKDLLRAIGKIETSDWNIKEIEKKIRENKLGKTVNKDKEKVPKWSKEQFIARQTKMEKKHLDRQDSSEAKYADIDKNIKHLDMKLKEGTARDLGQKKVATITEKLSSKVPIPSEPTIEKTNPRPITLPAQGGSEFCHFCNKRVYLMERLSAEGRFFHHGCFKCQYCHTQLRLGSYAFDREGLYGHKFFCLHHYGMQGEIRPTKVTRKPSQRYDRDTVKNPDKKHVSSVMGVDLLDRVQTPERIEFSYLSTGHASSDQEESLSQMDEDEWTDKNFGASCAELDSDEESSSSSLSSTDSDDEDAYDDALEEPVTKEGTLKWKERLNKRYSSRKRNDSDGYSSSDQSSYYENSSDDDESETATEGEEEIRARELRKQEVRVEPPIVQTDTGTDTEVVTTESSSESSSEIQNSATEISTDSEFAHDDPTPTREIPSIMLNDFHVTKARGNSKVKKIQVTSGYLQKPTNEKAPKQHIELKLRALVPSAPVVKKPAPLLPRTEGYALNRTQSTGGIATKVSLELKKRFLLGESIHPGNIQKSGSASTLDTKFKSFHTNISDCQKLLKPAQEISASMQTFCNKLDERVSPILSPQSSTVKLVEQKEHSPAEELPPPDVTNVTTAAGDNDKETYVFENESEGRPRSPVHETSIIVPKIDWSKNNEIHSEDSLSESSSENEIPITPNIQFANIPRVEVSTANEDDYKDNLPPDSLCIEETRRQVVSRTETHSSLGSEPPKSISSEKKVLNQPKSLPTLKNVLPEIHKALHVQMKKDIEPNTEKNASPENENKSLKTSSGRSSPDSGAEQATAAFTETELSDWARDGEVSDDLGDVEYELNDDIEKSQVFKKIKDKDILMKDSVKIANIAEFDDGCHVCGKDKEFAEAKNKTILTEAMTNILNSNLDNIEFMDTGTETSSDDGIVDSQNGYVLFKDEDELAEDSLNPNINNIGETKSLYLDEKNDQYKNTGYCILATHEENNFGGHVIDLHPSDLEKLKQKQNLTEHDEDSLLIVETGTTTEENTCSDSTVKNVTEITHDKNQLEQNKPVTDNNNSQKQRLEEKLAQVKAEQALLVQKKFEQEKESSQDNVFDSSNLAFEEHCQRLQSKVEFGNARDSIDIRKSRRKSKSDSPQKPDLIQEEKEKSSPIHSAKKITLDLKPVVRTPDILYKKEVIKKERDVNQKLIQEMVMNKMRAENKSLERKKRNRSSGGLSPGRPYDLTKSATTDVVSQINKNNLDKSYSPDSSVYATPDVLLSSNCTSLQNSKSMNTVPDINSSSDVFVTPLTSIKERNSRPLSVYSTFAERKMVEIKNKHSNACLQEFENSSLPDIRKNLAEEFRTPVAPPRQKHDDINKTTEKLKHEARVRARLLSNEELGLSPEDKLIKLRDKISKRSKEKDVNSHIQESIESLVLNTERRNSFLYSNDTLTKKKTNSFRRSKSGESVTINANNNFSTPQNLHCNLIPIRTKSISNFVQNTATVDTQNTKNKNNEDAIKICKSDPNLLDTECSKPKKKSKDRERRKSLTKMFTTLFSKKSPSNNSSRKGLFSKMSHKHKDISKNVVVEEPIRRRSLSEVFTQKSNGEVTPPPVPPLPLNYSIKGTDESSDGDHDFRRERSSCDTIDQSGILENSSLSGRRSSSKARRLLRHAQLKRHRMAQEIQRKLEETEVKTRELEERGVLVEKALRGEGATDISKDESDLLQEWFDLMRDRTELRRYEKELMVRAQELELEDRHARLQQELRERLENEEVKNEEDVKVEESIINEMMEIVTKRDSLIAVLEEDRLRYSNEDRDLEEQMLAKGLRLTPIRKTPEV